MPNFDEYIRNGEPDKKERASAWKTAIGLQAVDGLQTSDYLKDTAVKHIEGDISIDEVKALINGYYQSKTVRTPNDEDTEEADKVSANIARILNEKSFAFSVTGFTSIHRRLFEGVFKFAGKIRDYDITKKEWVLRGDTVLYVNAEDLRRAIEYDLEQEKNFSYKGLSLDKVVEHIAKFVSNLWQIHPFGEGNTRTTAVFTIKYLRSIGFDVNNDLFADSCGEVEVVAESAIEAITAVSGCGPGYVFMLIDALADAGVNAGLPRALAIKLAAQTFAGSGKMVLETALHPAQLRDQVTSPGGTTIAGIHALENRGVRAAMYDAVLAVLERSEKLKGK